MYEITAWDKDGCPVDYGNTRETEAMEREEPPYWCHQCWKFDDPHSSVAVVVQIDIRRFTLLAVPLEDQPPPR